MLTITNHLESPKQRSDRNGGVRKTISASLMNGRAQQRIGQCQREAAGCNVEGYWPLLMTKMISNVSWWTLDIPCRRMCLSCDYGSKSLLLHDYMLFYCQMHWRLSQFITHIGSMYGMYAHIWGILMVNFTIYTIHGSYGLLQSLLTGR